MAYQKYCPNCRKDVTIKEKWSAVSIIILIVLLLLGIILGLIYILYKYTQTERCPYCRLPANQMGAPIFYAGNSNGRQTGTSATDMSFNDRFCIYCGSKVSSGDSFCTHCGKQVSK